MKGTRGRSYHQSHPESDLFQKIESFSAHPIINSILEKVFHHVCLAARVFHARVEHLAQAPVCGRMGCLCCPPVSFESQAFRRGLSLSASHENSRIRSPALSRIAGLWRLATSPGRRGIPTPRMGGTRRNPATAQGKKETETASARNRRSGRSKRRWHQRRGIDRRGERWRS